jgi:curved DNA-binding protein
VATTDDYYRVLGVARDASREDIQRAYRRLARRHHPDVSPDPADEQHFRRIAEAYRVLSDPASRARYDRGRAAPGVRVNRGRGPTTSFGHLDIEDLLGGFAGTGRPGPGHRTGFGWPAAAGADLEAEIEINVEDAYTGGRGQVTVNTAAGIRRCEVTVPAGAVDGQRIRLAGMGAVAPGAGPPGDLYLVVRLAPHPRYRVDGRDLTVELPVTPWEAVLGARVCVDTPSGPVQVDLPAGSSTGRRLRLRGHGMPQPHGTPGDLYAEVKIVVPARSTDVERALFAQLAEQSRFDPRTPAS